MITIRTATLTDAGHLIEFQKKMAFETEGISLDHDTLAAGVHAVFEDPAKGTYYVAEENNIVVGCLMTTYEWSEWRCGTVLWIQSVYIDARLRGKGVYKKMYEHIQQIVLSDSRYRGIRLYVDRNNQAAQRVYEILGMNGSHYQVFEWMQDENAG